ncbi:MAG: hypothetical protein K0R38_5620 [Polyangiaceae bacterium]|jgi:hypothetical protein|nr:hypothetical protein [Polyangiaceae bacterium]
MTSRFGSFSRALHVVSLSALLSLGARPAHADSVTAEALFQSGREAMDKGDAKAACDRFEESYRLEVRPGTALNLGNCREALGQVATAWQRFQEAAQTLPAEDARLPIAKARAAALQGKVPKLTLRVPEDARGWVVLRDGVELGGASLNLALPVDPGPHRIEVRAPGRAAAFTTVELALSERKEVVLAPGMPQSQAATVDAGLPPAPATSGSRRTWGWVLGGVGVAGVATSLVTGAMVMSKDSTVEQECSNKLCSPAGLDAAQSGRTLSTVSTIAAVAGLASLGVGIYFLVSDDGSEQRARRQAAFGVVSSPGGASLQLRSSF